MKPIKVTGTHENPAGAGGGVTGGGVTGGGVTGGSTGGGVTGGSLHPGTSLPELFEGGGNVGVP